MFQEHSKRTGQGQQAQTQGEQVLTETQWEHSRAHWTAHSTQTIIRSSEAHPKDSLGDQIDQMGSPGLRAAVPADTL